MNKDKIPRIGSNIELRINDDEGHEYYLCDVISVRDDNLLIDWCGARLVLSIEELRCISFKDKRYSISDYGA